MTVPQKKLRSFLRFWCAHIKNSEKKKKGFFLGSQAPAAFSHLPPAFSHLPPPFSHLSDQKWKKRVFLTRLSCQKNHFSRQDGYKEIGGKLFPFLGGPFSFFHQNPGTGIECAISGEKAALNFAQRRARWKNGGVKKFSLFDGGKQKFSQLNGNIIKCCVYAKRNIKIFMWRYSKLSRLHMWRNSIFWDFTCVECLHFWDDTCDETQYFREFSCSFHTYITPVGQNIAGIASYIGRILAIYFCRQTTWYEKYLDELLFHEAINKLAVRSYGNGPGYDVLTNSFGANGWIPQNKLNVVIHEYIHYYDNNLQQKEQLILNMRNFGEPSCFSTEVGEEVDGSDLSDDENDRR